MFGELTGHEDIGAGGVSGESAQPGERGPEVDAMGARGARQAGVVAEPGGQIVDLHHVFPKASQFAKWFAERGIDVNDYCIELSPVEHQAQHGGGTGGSHARSHTRSPRPSGQRQSWSG